MLIDTRDHGSEPDPEPRPRRRRTPVDWRLWWWGLESVGLFVAAASLAGFFAVALAFAAMFATFKAIDHFCGASGFGLRDHRQ